MRVLLTNDDGIDAPGLQTLVHSVQAMLGEAAEITVVAPDRGRSECGHSVTTGRPLKIEELRAGWFAIDGTPVDCVRAALTSLTPQVDVVFSGVNAGANLGIDLLVSGTFAAAREASLHGISSMAVSHYRRPDVPKTWDHVPAWISETMREFIAAVSTRSAESLPLLWNVNLPATDPARGIPPRTRCRVDGELMIRTATRDGSTLWMESDFHNRPRQPDRDVQRCFEGLLTISELTPRLDGWG